MPTFCRHNRFIERCPICSRDLESSLPGAGAEGRATTPRRASTGGAPPRGAGRARRGGGGGEHLHVRREERALSDGFASLLLPGVHSSADASRLAEEIAFANGRLLALAVDPPGLYGELRALAAEDLEGATWGCFLTAYLSPLPFEEGADPFAVIRQALAASERGELPDPDTLALGPRTAHERGRGTETLRAYLAWAERSGQAAAFRGDGSWTPERRFQRVFERLALPGLGRAGRYELLVALGRLGLYELAAGSLALTATRTDDLTSQGAKRVFAIGDALLLERRAAALADAVGVPVEALDLALANWVAGERATLGFPPDGLDQQTLGRALRELGL